MFSINEISGGWCYADFYGVEFVLDNTNDIFLNLSSKLVEATRPGGASICNLCGIEDKFSFSFAENKTNFQAVKNDGDDNILIALVRPLSVFIGDFLNEVDYFYDELLTFPMDYDDWDKEQQAARQTAIDHNLKLLNAYMEEIADK